MGESNELYHICTMQLYIDLSVLHALYMAAVDNMSRVDISTYTQVNNNLPIVPSILYVIASSMHDGV